MRRTAVRMVIERNVSVIMRDGVRLSVNVFRANDAGRRPVVLSVTPYGKDKLPDRIGMFFMRAAGVRFGTLNCSRVTGFESPDPAFWIAAGYNVVQADLRGMHASEGHAAVLDATGAHDYAELIAWCAAQPWSTGSVGTCGVSYLAMSQWAVAALRPPALKAIIPWEGVTDVLREFGFQDGVRETGFTGVWWRQRMLRGHNPKFALAEDFLAERDARPLDDAWWAAKRPDLEAIDVPALVCASWSDQGLHTRGSFLGFERIASERKWLYTHGRRKWETFYSEEARSVQRRFFDRFLKGDANGWDETHRVRLEVRRSLDVYSARDENEWPLARARFTPLYLNVEKRTLDAHPPDKARRIRYSPNRRSRAGRASFNYRFSTDAELTGSMSLKLWVATSAGNDLDLFVKFRKLDARGREVHFYGYNGFAKDGVAKGWLRVSHRELDPARSRPGMPVHTHLRAQPVRPGEIVPVEIEILPSSTFFEAGSTLRIEIGGRDLDHYPAFGHRPTVNRGRHAIHAGASYDSHVLVPVVPPG